MAYFVYADFSYGRTIITTSAVVEGSELVASCETGSIFYPLNVTRVCFVDLTGEGRILNEGPVEYRPTTLQLNTSIVAVAKYRFLATREHNGKKIACKLFFQGHYKVESEPHILTVYCMQIF